MYLNHAINFSNYDNTEFGIMLVRIIWNSGSTHSLVFLSKRAYKVVCCSALDHTKFLLVAL